MDSDEIIPDPAQDDNKVVSTDKIPDPAQDEYRTSLLIMNSEEIIPDPAQDDINVVSTDQDEQKGVPDNNSSIPTLPQPQQPEAKISTNDSGPGGSTQALLNLVSRELEYIDGTCKTLSDYKDIVQKRIPGAAEKITKFKSDLEAILKKVEAHKTQIEEIQKEEAHIEQIEEFRKEDGPHKKQIEDIRKEEEEAQKKQIEEIQKELRQFKKHVRKLKLTIPPKFKINPADLPALEQHLSGSNKSVQPYSINHKLGKLELFKEKINYEYRSAFKDFQERYAALDNKLKLCLLCFSVFPEDEIIKKRLMVYWWIGEGFITPLNEEENEEERDLEQLGAEVFDELIKMDLIHSADGKGSQEVDNCKMQPFVRWAVILMAEKAKFFEFNVDGNPTEDYDSSFRACLVGNGLDIEKNPNLEKLHMLFNVNEPILELKPEWLSKMKNISVLCLGRWQAAAGHHIEVEETKFLEELKNMIHLRYLSLQGISRITKIPNSLSDLGKLTILDLRACHNLEEIPHDIGLLKRLTHLDLSECYLLAHMPKGLSKLANLLVLKGFLVVDYAKDKTACTLEDLTRLTKLRKLSIFTGLAKFPEPKDLDAFLKFNVLRKLKIVWGEQENKGQEDGAAKKKKEGDASTEQAKQENHHAVRKDIDTRTPANEGHTREKNTQKGLSQLEKLDLQCFPKKSAPHWLKPSELGNLKRLYIRGGQLRDLNAEDDHDWEVKPWNVERLRLKYLTGLGMNWTELLELFPKLMYLEKVRCPKLTLFPCDEAGVWLKK